MDVNYVKDGETMLWVAAFKGLLPVVKILLATPGIKVNLAKQSLGYTPLMAATFHGNSEVVKQLLTSPLIDVNQAETNGGISPLWKAAQHGRVEIVKLLLADPRLDLNQRGGKSRPANMPPIGIAAYYGRLEVVKLLLRCPKTDISFQIGGYTLVDAANADVREFDQDWVASETRVRLGSDSEIRQRKIEIVKAIQSRRALLDQGHTCPK